MANEQKTVLIEDAQIIFRNFAGKEGQYNREGDRNFGVILPHDTAEQMLADGWNVKYLKPREGDEEDTLPTPWLSVTVGFKIKPPKIVMLTSRARTHLTEQTLEILDWADIDKADLIVRGSEWSVQGKSGIKGYLQSLFVTIAEDALEIKYGMNEVEG
jgi:hypothetical protein